MEWYIPARSAVSHHALLGEGFDYCCLSAQLKKTTRSLSRTPAEKFIVPVPQGCDRMCTSPPCPNDCRTVTRNAKTRRRHMFRTYVRVYDAHRRQRTVPVGWWCPDCHVFLDDLR